MTMCDNEDNNNAQPLNGAIPTTEQEQSQDYTSFVFENKAADNYAFNEVKIGYFNANEDCILLTDIGIISPNGTTKEIKVEDDNIKDIYFFYKSSESDWRFRNTNPFKLEKNKKNIFKVGGLMGIIRINEGNPKQYPQ